MRASLAAWLVFPIQPIIQLFLSFSELRWLPHKLSKRLSLTTVPRRTPFTQKIFFNIGMLPLDSSSYHFLLSSWWIMESCLKFVQRIFMSEQTQHIIGSKGQQFFSSVYFSVFPCGLFGIFFRTSVRDSSVQQTISEKMCNVSHKDGGFSELISWLSPKIAKSYNATI